MRNFFIIFGVAALLSIVVKIPCLVMPWSNGLEYEFACYSDLQALYHVRHLNQRKIPYLEEKVFEYPPLIGVQMWLTSYLANSHQSYFIVNAVVNILWALAAFLALLQVLNKRKRLYYLLFSPAFIFYLHLNWDISTVAFVCLAICFFYKKQPLLSSFFLGVSISGKLYPLFFVPPFLFYYLQREKDVKFLVKLCFSILLGWGFLNFPFIIAEWFREGNIQSWLGVYRFHAARVPEFSTLWHWADYLFGYHANTYEYRNFVEKIFLMGMVSVTLLVLYQQKTRKNPWLSSVVLLGTCLMLSKIYTPQYALWLLPFFVILDIPAALIFGFLFFEFSGFISQFRYFMVMNTLDSEPWKSFFVLGVIGRNTFLLLIIFWAILIKKTKRYDFISVK